MNVPQQELSSHQFGTLWRRVAKHCCCFATLMLVLPLPVFRSYSIFRQHVRQAWSIRTVQVRRQIHGNNRPTLILRCSTAAPTNDAIDSLRKPEPVPPCTPVKETAARLAGSPAVFGAGVVDVTGDGVTGVGVTGVGVTGAGVLTATGPVEEGSTVGVGVEGLKLRSPSSPPGAFEKRTGRRMPSVRKPRKNCRKG